MILFSYADFMYLLAIWMSFSFFFIFGHTFLKLKKNYFWLCWVFIAVCGLSLVVVSGGYANCSSRVSLVGEHRLSCSSACGILASGPGIEPVSYALAGRVLTAWPPGKSFIVCFNESVQPWSSQPEVSHPHFSDRPGAACRDYAPKPYIHMSNRFFDVSNRMILMPLKNNIPNWHLHLLLGPSQFAFLSAPAKFMIQAIIFTCTVPLNAQTAVSHGLPKWC